MASLEISLNDISSEGLGFASAVTRMDLDLGAGDPEFDGDLHFSGWIYADANEAWVNGQLQGVLQQECVRCLSLFKNLLTVPVSACYRSEGEGKLSAENVDSYAILNCRFSLGEMLREQLILSIPIQALCQEQCQGLCQACGQNLNERQCGCDVLDTKSPFAILRRKFSFGKNLQGQMKGKE